MKFTEYIKEAKELDFDTLVSLAGDLNDFFVNPKLEKEIGSKNFSALKKVNSDLQKLIDQIDEDMN